MILGSWPPPMVLYMSFDRFLLAVESRDLSQADKRIIRVSSFSILQNFNFWMIKYTVITKKTIWHLPIWQNWCFGQFYLQDWKVNIFLSFSGERWIWEDWGNSFCRKIRPQLLRDRKICSTIHHLVLGNNTLL